MPREVPVEDDGALEKPETEDEAEGGVPVEQYVDFDLHIADDGRAVGSSSLEGEAETGISLEIPNTIELALSLIEARKTNAKLLKQVGQAFYDWLFPGRNRPNHARNPP